VIYIAPKSQKRIGAKVSVSLSSHLGLEAKRLGLGPQRLVYIPTTEETVANHLCGI